MDIKKIKENNIVVTLINRKDDKILLCRDRKTADYNFFLQQDETTYQKVSKPQETELRKIFSCKFSTDYFSTNENKKRLSKEEFKEKLDFALYLSSNSIKQDIKDLNKEDRDFCAENFNTLKINSLSNKEIHNSICAKYKRNTHTIELYSIPNNNTYCFCHILLHEIYHATAKSKYEETSGFVKIMPYGTNIDSDCLLLNIVGTGINEAMTDYLAVKGVEKYIKNNSNEINKEQEEFLNMGQFTAYDILVNSFVNILNYTDKDKVFSCYFKADLDGLLNYLKDSFYYENHDLVLSWVYKMDAFINVISKEYTESFDDYSATISDLYMDTFKIILNKLKRDNIDITKLKLCDVFSVERLPKQYKDSSDFMMLLEILFNFAKQEQNSLFAHNLITDCIKIVDFLGCAYNHKPCHLPKEMINEDFILHAFADNIYLMKHEQDISYKKMESFKYVFSENSGYFPDLIQKRKTITKLIIFSNQLNFNFIKLIPVKDLNAIIYDNIDIVEHIVKLDETRFMECVMTFDDNMLKTEEVIRAVAYAYMQMTNVKDKGFSLGNAVLGIYKGTFKNQHEASQYAYRVLTLAEILRKMNNNNENSNDNSNEQ